MEANLNEIHVEVKSNAKCRFGRTDNVPSHFTNDMALPLNFENGEWDVAMSSICYQHTWNSEIGMRKIYFLLLRTDHFGQVKSKQVVSDMGIPNSIEYGRVRKFHYEERETKVEIDHQEAEDSQYDTADVIAIGGNFGVIDSVEALGRQVAKTANMFFKRSCRPLESREEPVNFRFDVLQQRCVFESVGCKGVMFFEKNDEDFAAVFGYTALQATLTNRMMAYNMDGIVFAARPPKVRRVTELNVYSNICMEQRVGDSYTSLLNRVDANDPGNYFGRICSYRYDRLDYKPVKFGMQTINDIEIDIRDQAGDRINFQGGVTSIALIFRKRKSFTI